MRLRRVSDVKPCGHGWRKRMRLGTVDGLVVVVPFGGSSGKRMFVRRYLYFIRTIFMLIWLLFYIPPESK
jgi:hypothetical protein